MMRKILLGVGAGVTAGYMVVRAFEAAAQWRHPAPPGPRDAMQYARIRRALEVAGTIRNIAGAVSFAYGPLARAADRATGPAPAWLRPALFVAPLSLLAALVDLPASYVEEYELERRFSLSDQGRRAWLVEYAKSGLLSTALLSFVASLFAFVVRRAPRSWPWFAAGGALPLFVLGNLIVPVYVMPLFNAFVPIRGSLEARLRALAARFGVGDAAILRMDMSRQTRKANAFVIGVGKTHRIVVGDTLIEAFPETETEFVVAHELGHYVNRDTWRLIGVGELVVTLLFHLAKSSVPSRSADALRDRPLLVVRLYTMMLLASQLLRPLLLAFSRSREWAADRFALAATNDPVAGVSAFRRLREQNLADEDPPRWYELLFSSHPSLRERIAALHEHL